MPPFSTIPELLEYAAARFGAAHAIEDGPTTLTFEALQAKAAEAAAAFIARGVRPRDRVALWAPNMWEWIVAALGVHLAGGVIVPINTRYKGEEAAWLINKSGARLLVSVAGFLGTDYVEMLRKADADTPGLEGIVTLRGEAAGPDVVSWEVFLAGGTGRVGEVPARAGAVAPDDLSDMMFTSGTTGHPKGVMATHSQSLRAFWSWSEVVGLREGDRYLVALPFFHTFGYKAGWLACLMRGATILPHPVFDPGQVLARVGAERVSVLPGPPALYQSILARDDLDTYDLTPLRLAVTGAAVIPVDLIHAMRDRLGFDTIITGYGLTEATGIATMCRYDDDPETIATTSGRAIPDVEVRIVDDAGDEVPPGAPGEIVVRGYNVMQGYFDEPEETAATVDSEGWLHTGDIGTMDARGYIKITDRKKDMYIVGGFNAYPAEIEHALRGHEAVSDVAVVGVPDARLGEVGLAVVVPAPGAALDADALIAWSRERMANYKVPRRVEVVDALPRNAMGKVLKYQLRKEYAG